MSVCAIIPQSRLYDAKTRLAVALCPGEREALALALLGHVCGVVRATPGVERLAVVSPDPLVGVWGAARGHAVLRDPGTGLNAALESVLRSDICEGRGALIVPADLPWLSVPDVVALVAALDHGRIVLAPSKDGRGTGGLAVPPRTNRAGAVEGRQGYRGTRGAAGPHIRPGVWAREPRRAPPRSRFAEPGGRRVGPSGLGVRHRHP